MATLRTIPPFRTIALAFALNLLAPTTLLALAPSIRIDDVQIAAPTPPSSVPRHEKIELLIHLSNVAATALYNPDPTQGGLDLSTTFTQVDDASNTWSVNGFYDGSNWRVRFAPNATGPWTFTVNVRDSSGSANWNGGSFDCVASAHPGWARIDGTFLRFSNGQPLPAVGHNNGWQPDVEQPSLVDMASRGENLLSFWLAMPWAQPSWTSPEEPHWDDRSAIENPEGGLGNYNQAACAYIDGLVERAEAAGVYLLPSIWSHGQLRDEGHPWGPGWWYNNPYQTLGSATDFFKTTDGLNDSLQWRHQKNFFRYLIARWGHCRAIAGWVLVVEIDGATGYLENPPQVAAWHAKVAGVFRALDPFRINSAGAYPLVTSRTDYSSGATTWDVGLDMRAVDTWLRKGNDIEIAQAIGTQTTTMRASGKPSFHAEFGGDLYAGASQPAHLHNGLWAGVAAGAALTPLLWCDGGNFPLLTDASVGEAMRRHIEILAAFMAKIDYLDEPALTAANLALNDNAVRGWGLRHEDRGFAWLQKTNGNIGGQTVTFAGLPPGPYRVEWFNVWNNGATPIQTDTPITVSSNGNLIAILPTLSRADLACRFAYINQPPVAVNDVASTPEDISVVIAVLINDADPDDDPLTLLSATDGSYGTVSLNIDGTLTYVPHTDFNGQDSFEYTIGDGQGGSATATVVVTVTPVHEPGDLNDDGDVNTTDLTLVISHFGQAVGDPAWEPLADGNGDEVVNIVDLTEVTSNFGKSY